MIHMIRIRRRIILIMLHFLANVKGNFLTKLSVAESGHLFTNVMTDTQTHTHTETNRVVLVRNIMPFGIRRKSFALSYRILHWSLLPSSSPPIHSPITFLPPPFSFPCYQNLAGIFHSERTSSVPWKSRHKRNNEAVHVTP